MTAQRDPGAASAAEAGTAELLAERAALRAEVAGLRAKDTEA